MKCNKNFKGQGTIEYLIIIAIVIIIALVLVGILLSINPGSNVLERNAKITWSSQEPWAITDWSMDKEGLLTVVIKNNSADTLELNGITVNGDDDLENLIIVGVDKEVVRTIDKETCGGTYNYADVEISYNSGIIKNRIQYGPAGIAGQCSN